MLALCLCAGAAFEQGKIASNVRDADSGETLIGVNIRIDDTMQGTVTDVNGNYVLLNLRPGAYTLDFTYCRLQGPARHGNQGHQQADGAN